MRAREIAFGVCLGATAVSAGDITLVPYAPLTERLEGQLTFEALPERVEPGHNIDRFYVGNAVRVGSHFDGQQLGLRKTSTGTAHDALIGGPPVEPLQVLAGPAGQNLSVAFHRGFGSMALFPLGPVGFPLAAARGEGAAAFLFAAEQEEIGFRIHSNYPSPLGNAPKPGAAHVSCFNRHGQSAGQIDIPLATGITEIGMQFDKDLVAGCIITNTDPGGIAIDDVIYRMQALTG